MAYQLKTIITILAVAGIFGFFSSAQAAALSLAPVSSKIGVGENMTIELRIDSEGVSFNAAQAVVRFPKDTLEVIALDKKESAFSFWLEEPNFSNTDGVISFIGGTPYGVSGGSILVLKVTFAAKGSGGGTINLSDAAITASDGSGTNILSKMVDAAFVAIVKKETPPIPKAPVSPEVSTTTSAVPAAPVIPAPTQIFRAPVPTGKLPLKPALKVSLYPDDIEWSNLVSQFNVSWDLPLDITGISTALNQQPIFSPRKSEGLFDNKTFASLSDGVWYLHVRFKNNSGWGPTAHYRLAIDTQPPLGFELSVIEGESTDNPTPTFQFNTNDALSGLKEYQVRIGDEDPTRIPGEDFSGNFKLPLQAPGKRRIIVKAVDYAENSIENSMDIEIIPIASPTITFAPRELFPEDEQGLVVKGTALANVNILIKVQKLLSKGRGEVVAEGTARADDRGNWVFTFSNQPLRNGKYIILAQSQDARGALSLAVESEEVRVKSKPIIQFGGFQLGMGGALIFLLIIIAGGFSAGAWFYKKRQKKLSLRLLVVKTDLAKVFKLIQNDIEKLHEAIKTPTEADDEFIIKRLQENIKKMEGYLKKEIEKIKK
jgi:hypothetical protein